jgi:enterochelin esterase-like enzyme
MKNTLLIIIIGLITFTACEKREDKMIKYVATDAVSNYSLKYRDANGILQTVSVEAESAQDTWSISQVVEQGDIVYLSGKYQDVNSALKLIIYVDGKIYKQSNSIGDTLKYLTVSGVVPY